MRPRPNWRSLVTYGTKEAHISKLIVNCTEITRRHLTPEIALHLITPSCKLWKATSGEIPFEDPFWAFYWPGGQALTRFVLDNPGIVEGCRVLDLGSGCGASAIAAVKSGAKVVTANDIDSTACAAIALNARLNNVSLNISNNNLIGSSDLNWDCLLIGDMLYDTDFATMLLTWLRKCFCLGKHIYVGDPGRNSLACQYLQQVEEYDLPPQAVLENKGFSTSSIWTFVNNGKDMK